MRAFVELRRAATSYAAIETRVYYTPVLPEQPALRNFRPSAPLPESQRYGASSLALPMGESLDVNAVERVVEVVRKALG
jgi:dTDP-4-amino-4,6-dideoxygalactose transaminase